jgi:hypothetical protein
VEMIGLALNSQGTRPVTTSLLGNVIMKLNALKIGIAIGVTALAATGAAVLTRFPIRLTSHFAPAFIEQGEGEVVHGAYKLSSGVCRYAMSKPMTFYNPGQKAVTLEQLAPALGVQAVTVSYENPEIMSPSFMSEIFLTPKFTMNQLGLTAAELPLQKTFVPSYQTVDEQVYSEGIYTLYVIVIIDVAPNSRISGELVAAVRIDAIFNTGQVSAIETSLQIDERLMINCG